MATNVAIAVLLAIMIWLVGFGPFLLAQLPITLFVASINVWLFYIQHQFEDTFWTLDEKWNFHEAGLYGSSYYKLPIILRWFTANIGVHHVSATPVPAPVPNSAGNSVTLAVLKDYVAADHARTF